MTACRRDKLVPTSEAAIVAKRALGLRTTGRKRNIMRECTAQLRGSIPARDRFPGRDLMWQSPLEKRLLRMCVVSPSIVDTEAQPEGFYIPESDTPDAASFASYPDAAVAVRTSSGGVRTVIVECKPEIFAKAAETAHRLARIGTVLSRAHLRYVVLTELDLPDSLDSNLDRLFWARRVRLDWNFRAVASDAARGADQAPLGLLAERLGRSEVLGAIARGVLHADLWSPLGDDSAVYAQAQEGHDVSRVL